MVTDSYGHCAAPLESVVLAEDLLEFVERVHGVVDVHEQLVVPRVGDRVERLQRIREPRNVERVGHGVTPDLIARLRRRGRSTATATASTRSPNSRTARRATVNPSADATAATSIEAARSWPSNRCCTRTGCRQPGCSAATSSS